MCRISNKEIFLSRNIQEKLMKKERKKSKNDFGIRQTVKEAEENISFIFIKYIVGMTAIKLISQDWERGKIAIPTCTTDSYPATDNFCYIHFTAFSNTSSTERNYIRLIIFEIIIKPQIVYSTFSKLYTFSCTKYLLG